MTFCSRCADEAAERLLLSHPFLVGTEARQRPCGCFALVARGPAQQLARLPACFEGYSVEPVPSGPIVPYREANPARHGFGALPPSGSLAEVKLAQGKLTGLFYGKPGFAGVGISEDAAGKLSLVVHVAPALAEFVPFSVDGVDVTTSEPFMALGGVRAPRSSAPRRRATGLRPAEGSIDAARLAQRKLSHWLQGRHDSFGIGIGLTDDAYTVVVNAAPSLAEILPRVVDGVRLEVRHQTEPAVPFEP